MNLLEVILVLDIILNTQSQYSSNLIENVIFGSFGILPNEPM